MHMQMAGLMLRYYSDTLGRKEKMANLKQVKGHFEVRHYTIASYINKHGSNLYFITAENS